MGSEQIYVDDKFVGEIIQLDEKWTIRIDFGFLEDDICLSPFHDTFRKDFYIVTDPDIEPIRECPDDFVQKWFDILWKYPGVRKVGFSLKIDDLPDTDIKGTIIDHESQYYLKPIIEDKCYVAQIDTTMALYVPDYLDESGDFIAALRSMEPYQARHLPWYKDCKDVTEEDSNYERTNNNGWWNIVEKKVQKGN